MPAFRALVLYAILLQSLPHLGDGRRLKNLERQLTSKQDVASAAGTEQGATNAKETKDDLSETKDDLSAPKESVKPAISGEDRARITYNLRRQTVPNDPRYSLSYTAAGAVRSELERGPSRGATLGFAAEWLLFAGGYTWTWPAIIQAAYKRGNRGSAYTDGRPIQHIPTEEEPVIAYTVYYPEGVPNPPNKVIVFCHGNMGNIEHIYDFHQLAISLGAIVVGFEYPGYGHPDRDMEITTQGYSTMESVKTVTLIGVNWIRQVWGVDERDIVMAGQSIGTGAAMEVAWYYEMAGIPIAGVILISPYSSVRDLVRFFVAGAISKGVDTVTKLAINETTFQTSSHLSQMSETPVFAVHCEDDQIIPIEQFRAIEASIGEAYRSSSKVSLITIPKRTVEGGHNFSPEQMSQLFSSSAFTTWIDRNKDKLVRANEPERRDIDLRSCGEARPCVLRMVTPEPPKASKRWRTCG